MPLRAGSGPASTRNRLQQFHLYGDNVVRRDPGIAADACFHGQQIAARFLREDRCLPGHTIDGRLHPHRPKTAPDPRRGGFHPDLHGFVRRNGNEVPASPLARPQPQRTGDADHFPLFSATAARTSALKASPSTSSPSRMSIARLVPPSRLALNSCLGSASAAPRAKVSLTLSL